MGEMRALTVQQPFAWAIAYAGKTVENRSKPASYRGLLAIHAGLELYPGHLPTWTPEGRAAARALDALGGRSNFWNPRHHIQTALAPVPHPGLALGAIVAVAQLAGCHLNDRGGESCGHEGDWERAPHGGYCSPWGMPDQWHWRLADVRPLPSPVPCRGRQRLWPLPDDVERAVRAQLEESRVP